MMPVVFNTIYTYIFFNYHLLRGVYVYIYIYINYIKGVCKSIFAWNSAQYVEAERNKYFKRKKGRNLNP